MASTSSLSSVGPSKVTVMRRIENKTRNILNERNSNVLPRPKSYYSLILSIYVNKCISL